MAKTITPKIIDDRIISFCSSINSNTNCEYVNVSTEKYSLPLDCFENVRKKILKDGGKELLGWAIWFWPNILLEAEFHSIWVSESDIKIDITPHNGINERFEPQLNCHDIILFLPDDSIKYNGQNVPNKRLALTDSPLVAELIGLNNEKDRIMSESPASENTVAIPSNILRRIMEIQFQFNIKVGRNEKCPCESGLKYKKCCGGY